MKSYIFTLIIIIISNHLYAQTELYQQTEKKFLLITSNFKTFISTDESESFENIIEKYLKEITEYLEGGYGLTFDELNKIRTIKKYATAFENFYTGLRYNSGKFPISMKDIRLVMEYFPDIRMVIQARYPNSLIIYMIEINDYCVYVARHTDNDKIKRVHYSAKLGNKTQYGDIGLGYKCVRKIVDNVGFSFSKNVPPIITKQEIQEYDSDIFSFCQDE
jgi:hypothetical protein